MNEQTYASTLVENYVDPIKNANNKEDAIEDVKCGATWGATLIRDMINDAHGVVTKINQKE